MRPQWVGGGAAKAKEEGEGEGGGGGAGESSCSPSPKRNPHPPSPFALSSSTFPLFFSHLYFSYPPFPPHSPSLLSTPHITHCGRLTQHMFAPLCGVHPVPPFLLRGLKKNPYTQQESV